MTLWYPDVSNNNFSSDQACINFFEQLAPEGFAGVAQKVSEGNYYEDPYWPVVQQWCAENNFPCIGYHYVTEDNPASQAATWLANNGGTNAMFDVETNSGDLPNFWAVVNAFNAVGVNVSMAYIPHWYWAEIGSPDLSRLVPNDISLVSSAYPGGSGYASTIYEANGGDCGEGWAPYGNATPAAWQFTDQALVAGLHVDCNAYRGVDINALFTGATA